MTIVILDAHDAVELTSILEFFAGWLRADIDYARRRLYLTDAYSVDDLHTDTVRLVNTVKAC
jgi:hypothetical protein